MGGRKDGRMEGRKGGREGGREEGRREEGWKDGWVERRMEGKKRKKEIDALWGVSLTTSIGRKYVSIFGGLLIYHVILRWWTC